LDQAEKLGADVKFLNLWHLFYVTIGRTRTN